MKVTIKDLSAIIELKNKGMELEVRDPSENFLGDLIVTRTELIWCNGKTGRIKGSKISWASFIAYMNDKAAAAKVKPAKKVKAAPAVKTAKPTKALSKA